MVPYVAFLRGINLGGRNVTNDRLRALLEEAGFDHVRTFLSSGNVIFHSGEIDAAGLETRIESRLAEGLGYPVATFVRDGEHLVEVARHEPFPDDPPLGGKLHIGFLREQLGRATQDQVAALANKTDRVAFHGRELYWHVAGRFMDSALSGGAVARLLGDRWTLRTANTVRRIARKLAERPSG
ncbi:MAG TPA: DUF1697 domain-containing protein [Nitriliruptorales bacterium]|nr:DUF1697 domain-containing protein [Nitriliruptorales bacterium]